MLISYRALILYTDGSQASNTPQCNFKSDFHPLLVAPAPPCAAFAFEQPLRTLFLTGDALGIRAVHSPAPTCSTLLHPNSHATPQLPIRSHCRGALPRTRGELLLLQQQQHRHISRKDRLPPAPPRPALRPVLTLAPPRPVSDGSDGSRHELRPGAVRFLPDGWKVRPPARPRAGGGARPLARRWIALGRPRARLPRANCRLQALNPSPPPPPITPTVP